MMTEMMIAAAMLAASAPAPATTDATTDADPAAAPVAVLVEVPTPAGLPESAIAQGMAKAVPDYQKVPGLLRKYFTIGDCNFGGMYLFASKAAAQAWFNDAWSKRVIATYGKPATVKYFAVPAQVDNSSK